MNTSLTQRLAAAVASVTITAGLLAGVLSMTQAPAADALMAQAASTPATPVVR